MKLKTISISILASAIITISGISALGTISNAIAQKDVGWRTFISPEYKFTIEYPTGLYVTYGHSIISNTQQVAFGVFTDSKDSNRYIMSIHSNDMSLLDYIDKVSLSPLYPSDKKQILEKPATITVAGNSGYSFSYTSTGGLLLNKSVVFSHGDHIFELSASAPTDGFVESEYNHMVHSIKFSD
jgi:hypothetical protein